MKLSTADDMQTSARYSEQRGILLVSPVGFAHGWAPLGIALIKAYLSAYTNFQPQTLSLCVSFSNYIAREHPGLAEYDKQMGEWGSSFHELYFAAQYFKHAPAQQLIREAVVDYIEGQDIYRRPPWVFKKQASTAMINFHSERIMAFCQLIDDFSSRELVQSLRQASPFIVGFSVMVQQVFTAAVLARLVREILPSTTIVFGGPAILSRTAVCYRELFPEVDYFVYGDGEESLKTIAEHVATGLPLDSEPGILGRQTSAGMISQPVRQPVLRQVPFADFEEIGNFYRHTGFPLTTWFGRGCSWGKCRFCSIPEFQRRLLNRPVEDLYGEISHFKTYYGTSSIRFGDWEVNGSPKDLQQFCSKVIENNHHFEFWGEVNARNLSSELVNHMKQAGFVSLQVGLEAFSDGLLRKMKKPATLIDNIRAMILAHQFDIELFSNIIFNFPGETREDLLDTLRVIKLIRHLLSPPVKLALLEFLLETDADVYQNLDQSDEIDNYRFESRCFPDQQKPYGPYFLKQWMRTPDPLWAHVEREIELSSSGLFEFNHFIELDLVHLEDSREGKLIVTTLSGSAAKVYQTLIDQPSMAQELSKTL
ncbi:MAG: radical SAM protein, partial [Acidobacteriota bacterium]